MTPPTRLPSYLSVVEEDAVQTFQREHGFQCSKRDFWRDLLSRYPPDTVASLVDDITIHVGLSEARELLQGMEEYLPGYGEEGGERHSAIWDAVLKEYGEKSRQLSWMISHLCGTTKVSEARRALEVDVSELHQYARHYGLLEVHMADILARFDWNEDLLRGVWNRVCYGSNKRHYYLRCEDPHLSSLLSSKWRAHPRVEGVWYRGNPDAVSDPPSLNDCAPFNRPKRAVQ